LRAEGVVTSDSTRVVVAFGEGENAPKREVPVMRQAFSNGGSWTWYVCPICGGLARVLRLHERPMCRRCCRRQGLRYRCERGSLAERAEARAVRIEKLRELLTGGPARLCPRRGRVLDRRGSLEVSLRRALIAARQGVLG
jgi:hypothetical protein